MTQSEATASMKIYQTGDLAVSYEDDAVHIAYKGLPNHTATIIRVEEGKIENRFIPIRHSYKARFTNL